jgi:hypothetical protein
MTRIEGFARCPRLLPVKGIPLSCQVCPSSIWASVPHLLINKARCTQNFPSSSALDCGYFDGERQVNDSARPDKRDTTLMCSFAFYSFIFSSLSILCALSI